MSSPVESLPMLRSASMPVKPKPLETKPLARSSEKETVNEADYYPESPGFVRRRRSRSPGDHFETRSEQNFPYTHDWAGSTIELTPESAIHAEGHRRSLHRVMEKNGNENVVFRRIPEKSWRYMRDVITTLMELEWKYMLTLFLGSYFLSWLLFAVLCYVVSWSHGDFLFDEISGVRLGEGDRPCIYGVTSWVTMIIYSVETQTTLGFGEKYASEECPETVFLFIMQMVCAALIEGSMVSLIYAKTARPARQMTKLKFSDKAVICYRDGKLCLLFRVCDPREQQSIESKIRVYMIVDKRTREGEIIKTHTELKLQGNGEQLILWPDLVCHVIDASSPLHQFTNAKLFNAAQFELYVSIVGTSPATAQMTEAKTSYVPREIFWGQRFVNIIHYDATNERYVVDYENFNRTISVDMPLKQQPASDHLRLEYKRD
ncbi:inward rectifier potassium channel irk-1 [Drosophila guanche]|uniref:Blast:Inward rectifier potassium channel irk-1 n=1 Tax=Drosophila guanche TaxID=7266 RepID=A0A3B0K4W8_DROGU|nr:inward rectifier potassium channel irk-1 [Drosophila guanche]SPP79981.1 blast:Inward rectifier potassium channel irk-1 [Drosophila guanche]